MELDGIGIAGVLLHFSLLCAMSGSALLLFLYLLYKGRLDMDESVKFQMMEEVVDTLAKDLEEKDELD